MRIERVDLIAHGPFTDHVLDLSAPGVHLVVGANEAGKSSALAAITDSLYGIPRRSDAAFVHANHELRVGVAVTAADGTRHELVRVRRRKDTLRDADGNRIYHDPLPDLLGGLDREAFLSAHGLTRDRLVKGGRDLVAGRGELGRALFEATTGAAGLDEVLAELESRAEAVFPASGTGGTLPEGLGELAQLDAATRDAQLRAADLLALEADLSEARAELQSMEERRVELERRRRRAELLSAVLPQLRERRRHLADAERLRVDTRLLRAGIADDLESATSELQTAGTLQVRAQRDLEALRERIGGIGDDGAVLAARSLVESLRDRRGEYETKDAERRVVAETLGDLHAGAAELLDRLRPGIDPQQAAATITLDTVTDTRLRSLAERRPQLDDDLATATATLAAASEEADRLHREIAAAAPVPDDGALRASLSSTRADGDLEGLRRGLAERARRADDAVQSLLGDLGLSDRSPAQLVATAVPSTTRIEVARTRLESVEAEQRAVAERLTELGDSRRATVAELDALPAAAEVPTRADLEGQRAERDALWHRVRTMWLGEPALLEPPDHAPWGGEERPRVVAATYESAVEAVDRISDALREDAALSARREDLEGVLGDIDDRISTLDARLARCAAERDRWDSEWASMWRPVGVPPGRPSEMVPWVARFARLRDAVRESARIAAELAEVSSRATHHRDELVAGLAVLGVEVAPDSLLATVAERADAVVAELAARRATRADAERDLERHRSTARDAEAAYRRVLDANLDWEDRWRDTVGQLGLPDSVRPDEALAFVDTVAEWRAVQSSAAADERRLATLEGFCGRWEEDCDALFARVGVEAHRVGDSVDRVATLSALVTRLEVSLRGAAQVDELEVLVENRAAELERANAEVEAATRRIAMLMDEAGVDNDADLADMIERSDRLRRAEAAVEALDDALAAAGGGRSAEDLEAELSDDDEVSLLSEVDAVEAELADVRGAEREAAERLAGLRRDRARMDGSDAAARLAAEAAGVRADVEDDAAQYVGLRLAADLLSERIEDLGGEDQAPLLELADRWFVRITGGAFAALETDTLEDGTAVLEAVRPDGERVGVEAMSEGTADALYLVLRLAAVTVATAGSEPVPMMLDDVLVNFDDERAAAVFGVLAEMAEEVQVVVFTHHHHLVEVATEALGARVVCHELSRRPVNPFERAIRAGGGQEPATPPTDTGTDADRRDATTREEEGTADGKRKAAKLGKHRGDGTSGGRRRPPAEPAAEPEPLPKPARRVLAVLAAAGKPLRKKPLRRAARIQKDRFGRVMKPLLRSGRVEKVRSKKKGTRYRLPRSEGQ